MIDLVVKQLISDWFKMTSFRDVIEIIYTSVIALVSHSKAVFRVIQMWKFILCVDLINSDNYSSIFWG